jgi:hypothetical protein
MNFEPTHKRTQESNVLDRWSLSAKDFYSPGSTLSSLGCAATVLIVWQTLARLWSVCAKEGCALLISFLIVTAYALVLPEPEGYPNQHKFRLTLSEIIFGFFNTFIVFSVVLTLKNY